MQEIAAISGALSRRLVDSLYVEVLVLADEARAYFDEAATADREALDPMMRVSFSCESLKVTTRLMHVIAWLLTHRACHRGEIRAVELVEHRHRLGDAATSDPATIATFPFAAQKLIEASQDIYARVARLEGRMLGQLIEEPLPISHAQERVDADGPARALISRLESAF